MGFLLRMEAAEAFGTHLPTAASLTELPLRAVRAVRCDLFFVVHLVPDAHEVRALAGCVGRCLGAALDADEAAFTWPSAG